MSNRYDAFDDVLSGEAGVQEGGGILDSQGLRDYEGIETRLEGPSPPHHQGGVAVTLNCRHCNKKRKVILEWPEIIVVADNGPGKRPLLPQGWKFSQNNLDAYVMLPCPSCGQPGFAIHMTPEEAQQHVRSGVNSGLLNPQAVQQLQQQNALTRSR